jgi:hypothetical protein
MPELFPLMPQLFPLMPRLFPLMPELFPLMPELHAASEGMLKWLKAPTLPRPFVLDLLDFVLGNSAAVFRWGSVYFAQSAHAYEGSSGAHMPCTCMPVHRVVKSS